MVLSGSRTVCPGLDGIQRENSGLHQVHNVAQVALSIQIRHVTSAFLKTRLGRVLLRSLWPWFARAEWLTAPQWLTVSGGHNLCVNSGAA
jgi:hypothetical protein